MEQPQTIGDEHQPDVEWDPPPALHEKFTTIDSRQSPIVVMSKDEWTMMQLRIKGLEEDAALGALLRRLPECTALIRTPDRNGPQEWTVLVGDYAHPQYYTNGSTPEEALRNLFQCMAGES